MNKKLLIIIPFIVLFALLALFWRGLFYTKPSELPSTLIGETIPNFRLPRLQQPQQFFTAADLKNEVSLLNVWATWCEACTQETEMLMKIKQTYHVPIYSIDYKDKPNDAIQWLKKYGNPYDITGSDLHGDVAIDLGVYGTPETFVISPDKKIIYRHIGVIDQKAWDEVLYPLIKQYTQNPYPFTRQEDSERFSTLINETRCVVCQNQSIADSNAPLANDLRGKIYQMVIKKKSNEEIQQYLVKRYGEFILLRPRFHKLTVVLWAFPIIAIAFVLFFLFKLKR